jgi:hypothetical protein
LTAIVCGALVFVILPAIFMTLIFKKEEKLNETKMKKKYGYLYSGNKIETRM